MSLAIFPRFNSFHKFQICSRLNVRPLINFKHSPYFCYYDRHAPFMCCKDTKICYYSSENRKDFIESAPQKTESIAANQSTKVNQKTRLKQAVRDYGATIIVFHVAISLASLGICYVAISNGVDAIRLLKFIGFSESVISSKVAVGGSTFVIAYAVHKLFAPVRIGVTLSIAPFIVRYLRKINLLKPPKKKD